jgi:hypothetical protein
MTKDLRSAQQVSSSSQGVHLLQKIRTAEILLAHLGPQSALSRGWSFLESKKKKKIHLRGVIGNISFKESLKDLNTKNDFILNYIYTHT